jgi:TP901 family phage tail tape measure protein
MGKKLRDEDLVLNIIVNGDRGRKEILDLEKAIKGTNRELRLLQLEQEQLRKAGKKETAEYKAVTAAIELKNSALDKARGRLAQLRQGMDLSTMSMSDLRREITRLTKLRNIAQPLTEEWKHHNDQLNKVKARYDELSGKTTMLGKIMGSNLAKGIGAATVAIGALVIAGRQIMRVVDDFGRFEDVLADVRKTTGLTFDQIEGLNNEIKSMDSRTSQEDLLKLARTAGKLGIQGAADVMGFVRAADQIGVALSEDLGGDVEMALRQVGKLVDVFGVREEFGIEQGLLKVGSAINELGINSTAQEDFMVDFTNRLAGVAPAAGISIANILGLSSTLDQLAQRAEVAGTTFVNLIPELFTNPEKFAKIAGIELNEFNHLLNNDTNEALIRLFEGVKGNEQGMSAMAHRLVELGMDGARAKNIISALANSTAILRSEQLASTQAFEAGASVTNEFTIKNETLAASVDKLKRFFFNLYMNSTLRTGLSQFFASLVTMIQGVETATEKLEKQNLVVKNLERSLPGLMSRYNELNALSNRSAEENEELRKVIDEIVKIVPTAATGFDSYGRAVGVSTSRVDEFTEAQKALAKFFNKDSIKEVKGGLIDTLTQIELKMKQLSRRDAEGNLLKLVNTTYGMQNITKEVKMSGEEIAKLQNQLADLRKQESEQRLVLGGLTGDTENPVANDPSDPINPADLLTDEQKAEIERQKKEAAAESKRRRSEAEKEAKQLEDARLKELAQQEEYRRKVIINRMDLVAQENIAYEERLREAGIFGMRQEEMTEQQLAALRALEADHLDKLNDITSDRIDDNFKLRQARFDSELQAMRTAHNEEYKSINTLEQARAFLQDKVSQDTLLGIQNMRQAQVALDKHFLSQEEALTKEYLQGLLTDLQTLGATGQLEGIDLANQVLSPEQKAELEARIAEVKQMMSELGIKSSMDVEADRGERKRNVDVLGFSPDDWDLFFENLDKGKIGFQEVLMAAQAMTGAYAQYSAFVSAGQRRELQEFERGTNNKKQLLQNQLDAGIISQDQYTNQVAKLEADLDRKKAVFDRNEAKRERNVALMSAIVNTAAAIASALPNVALSVLVGALGAIQIGTILKAPLPDVPGAESGGRLMDVRRSQDGKRFRAKSNPNQRGFVDRPTVIVGENGEEFVANAAAVRNPTIAPVLSAIDTAQRNGSISTLNLDRILEENRIVRSGIPGRAKGGRISGQSGSSAASAPGSAGMSMEMMTLLKNTNKAVSQLNLRLSKPIKADVSLTGQGSLQEKTQELERITKSASI